MPFFELLSRQLKVTHAQSAQPLAESNTDVRQYRAVTLSGNESPRNTDPKNSSPKLKTSKYLFSAGLAFLLAAHSQTTLAADSLTIEQQRQLYEETQTKLRLKKITYSDVPYDKLENYPLTSYLKFQELNKKIRTVSGTEIDAYLSEYPGSWLSDRLRINWLKQLAASKKWTQFRQYYDSSVKSVELKCMYLQAEYRAGNKDILGEVSSVWNQGKSQPKACDRIFSTWLKSDYFTPEIAWSRYLKAIEKRKLSLASYIERHLKDDVKPLAKQLKNLYHYPSRLNRLLSKTDSPKEIEDVIHYGVKRYSRHNAKATLSLWEKFDAAYLLDADKRNETTEYLAYRLILDGKNDLANRLLERNQVVSERIIERQLRDALKQQDWKNVKLGIAKLPEESQQSHRWRYWQLRASEALNELSQEKAQQGYLELSVYRDFYSFLAAERAQMPYELAHQSVQPAAETLSTVGKIPALERSRELFKLGKINQARMEWRYGTRGFDTPSLIAVGALANDWGWHRKTIESLGKAKFWDDLTLRFPLIYQDEIQKVANATTLAPEYLLAIARQESAFAPDARSPAGAMGLMQLMPATANQTAKRMGIPYRKKDLLVPQHNILIGGNYLGQMLTRFNGNRILATAAYNAGPHRVSRWLNPENKRVDFDIWIETIPFKETRGYVQNVLSYSLIYSHLMGEEKKLLNQKEWEELL